MAFFSGLRRPAGGAEHFLAAIQDKIERDRRLAAQAMRQGDPAEAAQILARSRAIDAQRAEAKERARQARMEGRGFDLHGGEPFGRDNESHGGIQPGPLQHEYPGAVLRQASFPIAFPALAEPRHMVARSMRSQAEGGSLGIPDSPARQAARPSGVPVGGLVDLDSRDASGQVDLGRPHGTQERAGVRTGEGLGDAIRAAFKPPASPGSPEEQRRIVADKLRQIGGLNGVGYIPRPEDYGTLARIIYSESHQHPGDFAAVGWSTINRVARDGFQPTLNEVLHAPGQFAIVAAGNPGGVDSRHWINSERPEQLRGVDRERWLQAEKTARAILDGQLPDPTGGATRFFASPDYHLTGRAPGDFTEELLDGDIVPSKFRTTSTSGWRQYFFNEASPPRPISREQ